MGVCLSVCLCFSVAFPSPALLTGEMVPFKVRFKEVYLGNDLNTHDLKRGWRKIPKLFYNAHIISS